MSGHPKRVLHVVRGMARAGIETWLMHVLRHSDPSLVHMDFLVHTSESCAFDAEIEARGSRILRVAQPLYSPAYGLAIRDVLADYGPYDALHSHVHAFSGYLLRLARWASVPVRIAHSHSDTSRKDSHATWLRRRYLAQMRDWIFSCATELVAASAEAGQALFGLAWDADPRRRLLHCGIDFEPFRHLPDRDAVRAAWEIGKDDFVVGHVGRFDTPKNHAFLVEIAAELIRRRPETRLLLVGDGPLRSDIVQRTRDLGISSRVTLAGLRQDVPDLLSAMDAFVFPSYYEGLPLTLLEAQAAGLPCVVSEAVTDEADVVPALIRRVSLIRPAHYWAECVLRTQSNQLPRAGEALAEIERSSFTVQRSINELYGLYGV